MVGAFFACLMISAYMYEGLATGKRDGEGFRIEGVSTYLLSSRDGMILYT